MYTMLTKKDVVAFNQEIGEGRFRRISHDIEENGKECDKEKLLKLMKLIAKNHITHPVKIARLLYGTIIEKNN